MNTTPKVIGFVPAYNAEKFIIPTLEALANQTYPNFEVIVCDDASKDGTFELCKDFASDKPNFKVIQNQKNLGWFKTSELLWTESTKTSKYCFTNPHDDLPYPNYVSELVSLLESNPQAVVAIPGMENIYPNGEVKNSFFSEASNEPDLASRTMRVAKRNIVYWWAAYHGLHRSKAVTKILPVTKLPFGEKEFSVDLIWVVKMSLAGEFVTSDKLLLKKKYLEKSLSATWAHNSINKSALWVAILNEFRLAQIPTVDKRRLWKDVFSLAFEKIKLRTPFT